MNEAVITKKPVGTLLRDFLVMCKPKVVLLMLFTAIVGMFMASPYNVPWSALVFGTLGIALASASGAVLNHLLDRQIDAVMRRTENRPLPMGRIAPRNAFIFAIILAALSVFVLVFFVNTLTAMLSLFALIGYGVVYTWYLKRATPQNIVIGGAAGAMPPLLGWVAVTGQLDAQGVLLALIIFVWTPPHFWALAIHRQKEYSKASVPMLPITHGVEYTKLQVLLYIVLLIVCSVLPFVIQMSSVWYLIGALLLGAGFLYWACVLLFTSRPNAAIKTFAYSNFYLTALFFMLLLDHYIFA